MIGTIMRNSFRVGELEHPDEYTYLPGFAPPAILAPASDRDGVAGAVGRGAASVPVDSEPRVQTNLNGVTGDPMDVDIDLSWWEGAEPADAMALDAMLDVCLAAGS